MNILPNHKSHIRFLNMPFRHTHYEEGIFNVTPEITMKWYKTCFRGMLERSRFLYCLKVLLQDIPGNHPLILSANISKHQTHCVVMAPFSLQFLLFYA